ncbi:uncharacterized protein STEHIDRAFT_156894 [Stereum hirsutum FP-91666 SS1]|uniref:uncharacterized protein n=1 Tax=Stereum hirsutum (strain FP-91666) TaxID=721885 RepID=UPI0004409D40|nr:uncharacterized protein STEHIDRAFT_156894 [Stereum hirsutum FP-91666 SS1]EIM86588.1 hypothetical protein STEHIDRAFT_156894 [Stereum hirsutum FP-91666 SS1]
MPAIVSSTFSSSESEHTTGMMQVNYDDIPIQPTPTSTTISGTGGHHVESVVLAAACGIIASGLFILVVFLLLRRRTQHAVGRSQKHMTWMQRSNEWGGHLPIQVELKTASLTRSKSELTTNTTQERSLSDEK